MGVKKVMQRKNTSRGALGRVAINHDHRSPDKAASVHGRGRAQAEDFTMLKGRGDRPGASFRSATIHSQSERAKNSARAKTIHFQRDQPAHPGMTIMVSHHECELAYLATEVTPPATPYVTK